MANAQWVGLLWRQFDQWELAFFQPRLASPSSLPVRTDGASRRRGGVTETTTAGIAPMRHPHAVSPHWQLADVRCCGVSCRHLGVCSHHGTHHEKESERPKACSWLFKPVTPAASELSKRAWLYQQDVWMSLPHWHCRCVLQLEPGTSDGPLWKSLLEGVAVSPSALSRNPCQVRERKPFDWPGGSCVNKAVSSLRSGLRHSGVLKRLVLITTVLFSCQSDNSIMHLRL